MLFYAIRRLVKDVFDQDFAHALHGQQFDEHTGQTQGTNGVPGRFTLSISKTDKRRPQEPALRLLFSPEWLPGMSRSLSPFNEIFISSERLTREPVYREQ